MSQGERSAVVPCLAYHRLHSDAAPSTGYLRAFSIDVGLFREQLAALQSANYTVCPLNDLLLWRRSGSQPPDRPIVITFDDGWASNLTLAAPELRRYRMPWTIFAVADGRARLFSEGGDLDRALTHEEITQLSASGVAIESHGLTHRPLTEISPSDLEWELHQSRARLEAITQQPVGWIAAPFGLANVRVLAAVEDAGYHGVACGLIGGTRVNQTGLVRLRRIAARPDWTGERLLTMVTPGALRRAALVGNTKRCLRVTLGHTWSSRLRSLIRRRS